LRVKLGEYEVELSGTNREVMRTIKNLPDLVKNVNLAFERVRPKTVATITVKSAETSSGSKDLGSQGFPKITSSSVEDGILKVLQSDWGKWRPRTLDELGEVLRVNGVDCPGLVLPSVLEALTEKGSVRQWNTKSGCVYILSDVKKGHSKGE
jgi:hypothetical protein